MGDENLRVSCTGSPNCHNVPPVYCSLAGIGIFQPTGVEVERNLLGPFWDATFDTNTKKA
jgi:hypothetical protein